MVGVVLNPDLLPVCAVTVNHQLLGDEGQLKVHVNIKFMSRSLNFLLTQMGEDVWLINFKFPN